MKKMMVMAAFAVAVMAGSVANAAAVDILVEDAGGGTWTVSVTTSIAVQAMVLQTSGFADRTFGASANVSPLDSPFVNGGLQINSPAGQNLLGAGTTTLVATLLGGTGSESVTDGEVTFGYTVLDATGNPLLAGGEAGVPSTDSFSLTVPGTVPEPASAVLLGLGLAGLAMLRRKAA